MSEETGPKLTEESSGELLQKSVGIQDGTQITITVTGGRVAVAADRGMSPFQMALILQAGYVAFEMEMEKMLSSPNLTNKH